MGYVHWTMRKNFPDGLLAQFVSSVPWGRFGEPDEVAAPVSWLASDEAEYINGQCISMNGAEMLF
jgi:NAD(P)-dependent dehydrogenase (short-subunit alcohol dehydrogenase family)